MLINPKGASLENRKANVNATDKWNHTPLHFAAQKGKLEMVESLLTHGADVNARNSDGMTPLHLAARDDRRLVFENLIKNGANLKETTNDGWTCLHYASLYGKSNTNRNANDLKATDLIHSIDLLHFPGRMEITQFLVRKDVSIVNALTKDLLTPLNIAQANSNFNQIIFHIKWLFYFFDFSISPQMNLRSQNIFRRIVEAFKIAV